LRARATTPAANDGLAEITVSHRAGLARFRLLPFPQARGRSIAATQIQLRLWRRLSALSKKRELTVSQPSDASEIEADNIADQVMRMSDSRGSGVHLDRSIQSFMQSRLGADFSDVRIHTDGNAVHLNRLLNAKAFTVGNNIYFNQGLYQPDSPTGKHLLAHELTHTIQQGRSPAAIQRQPLDDSSPEDPIHGPLLDAFSAETGVPREQASPHSPEYEAWLMGHDAQANPAYVLNHAAYTSARYSSTVSAWPNDLPIWQALATRQAQINFVRFILSFDETNCVPLAGQNDSAPKLQRDGLCGG
jgi:hypothetical protein